MSESPAPAAAQAQQAALRAWLLLGQRAGDRAQVEAVGAALAALGWSCEPKRIVANGLFRIPNLLLGASLVSMDRQASAALTPPWPELVIAAGRRSVPAALWIRRQTQGRARLVHIGRPWAPLRWFDLVVTTAQYGLPERPNVLRNALPVSPLDRARLDEAAARWAPRLATLPRPWIAVLVGGEARPYRLDAAAAGRLGREASQMARAAGGSLLVSTSPRTPADAADALQANLEAPHHLHRWAPGADNPYPAFLALADRLVVTGDSASMLAEACATGRPVRIFPLPERPDLRLRGVRAFQRLAKQNPLVAAWYDRLVDLGLVTSVRDMSAFHEELYRHGLAAPMTEGSATPASAPQDGLARTIARIQTLFEPEETRR